MALKIFAIAVVLFIAEIVFLTTKDFKDNKTVRKDIDFTDIVFENIDSYLLTKDGCKAKLKADKVLKYDDHINIYSVDTNFNHKEVKNFIKAKKATLEGDTIHLFEDINYENNNSLHIKSEDLVYNTKTNIVEIKTPFVLTSVQGKVKGENLIYDQQNGTIKAKNIKYESIQ